VSADNYNLIRHGLDGRFRVWLNLSDSCNQEQQVRDAKPNAEFDDYEVALEWTMLIVCPAFGDGPLA